MKNVKGTNICVHDSVCQSKYIFPGLVNMLLQLKSQKVVQHSLPKNKKTKLSFGINGYRTDLTLKKFQYKLSTDVIHTIFYTRDKYLKRPNAQQQTHATTCQKSTNYDYFNKLLQGRRYTERRISTDCKQQILHSSLISFRKSVVDDTEIVITVFQVLQLVKVYTESHTWICPIMCDQITLREIYKMQNRINPVIKENLAP